MKKMLLAGAITSALLLAACSSDEEAPKEKVDNPVATEKEEKIDKTKEQIVDEKAKEEPKGENETYETVEELKAAQAKKREEIKKAQQEREKNIKPNNTVKKINKKVVDNEKVSAILTTLKWKKKEQVENAIEITFDVNNKTANAISVQASELVTDRKKVDQDWFYLQEEIPAGKTGKAVLVIRDYKNGDLPALEEKLEMILEVIETKDNDKKEIIDVYEYKIDLPLTN